jgi:hypothetical protein
MRVAGYNGEVQLFWYNSDSAEHSAKLVGSLTGSERDEFWAEKKSFLAETEAEEERQKQEQGK